MPFLSTALAIAGIAAGTAGVAESASNSGTASQAAQEQNQIAQQEANLNAQVQADRQQTYNQANQFYTPYTQQGSPYLSNIQSAAAGQNAQQFGNAAGQLRQTMQQSGLGYGPSGTTGAAIGQLGTEAAQNSASNYLQNLLNNEQVKFQAQQGLLSAGQLMTPFGQNLPTNQVTQTTTGSSVNALGQSLQNLLNSSGQPQSVPQAVNQTFPTNYPGSPVLTTPPMGTSIPTTQGFQL